MGFAQQLPKCLTYAWLISAAPGRDTRPPRQGHGGGIRGGAASGTGAAASSQTPPKVCWIGGRLVHVISCDLFLFLLGMKIWK
jgi:hypothetical protein